jgi:metal-dependent amidase/aminoacylase/carboxypeptidase family protein
LTAIDQTFQYEEICKKLHANPELSDLEEETAKSIEDYLTKLSPELEIKTKIGGFGLVAICKNGSGRMVLLRADFDTLPIAEMTGLDYASKKKMKDANGDLKPVMHGELDFSGVWKSSKADHVFVENL